MTSDRPFRCVLIGGDTLLVACGDLLLSRGHRIAAVLTRARVVLDWAAKNGIPAWPPGKSAASSLESVEFDHLFSIAHLSVVPDEILALARGERINFHDAPLPRLAGLNTPNWAILRGEKEHGVTWHRMTSGVDEGEILAQELFPVDADETGLSLNTKCFEAGLRTFADLVESIAAGRLSPRAQDLRGRAYCARSDRPAAAGALDWTKPADELATLVRALDAGRYKNAFAVPSVSDGHECWIVRRARVSADDCASAPGTLLASPEGEIAVATGRGALGLLELATASGRSVPLAHVRTRVQEAGGRFAALSPEDAARLTRWNSEHARHEEFWIGRLAGLAALELPFLAPPTLRAAASERRPLGSAAALLAAFPGADPRAVLGAALAAWIARLTGREDVDLAWGDARRRSDARGLERWIAARVPARFHARFEASFRDVVSAVGREVQDLDRRGAFLNDVVARDPALAAEGALAGGFALPTALEFVERLGEPIHLLDAATSFVAARNGDLELVVDAARLPGEALDLLADSLAGFLGDAAAHPEKPLAACALVSRAERERVLSRLDATDRPHAALRSVPAAIESAADRRADEPAVTSGARTISYRELDARANQLARRLQKLGARRGTFVGVCLERSVDLVVGVLAVQKSGAAYLPLDPAFPEERTRFMLEDSGAKLALASTATLDRVASSGARILRVDEDAREIEAEPATRLEAGLEPGDVAYVIYTSGSTGKPKGVLVEHGNVLNFFAGMDERIPHDPPGTWLAVTSLSFDISVLELFWTLACGFHVIVHQGRTASSAQAAEARRPVDFSLFYFASDERKTGAEKYKLLLDGARFADEHGFSAVWTPERHFHAFGGLYPDPAVAAAAIAAITKRVSIRAGSVVLPLHHPARVAEAWSVVDNLSNGRIGISFASGWQPNDFVLQPQNYARAKQVMFENIEVVRRLWRGEEVAFPGPKGDPVSVRTLPRPVQKELPVWITTAGNPETYVQAGTCGGNVLTHLLGQSVEDLAPKIEAYRRARAEAGFDAAQGKVTLMLHTFVSEDGAEVRDVVREPLRNYLGTSLDLLKKYAWAFPAFKKPKDAKDSGGDELAHLTPEERDAMLEHAFERYFETSGLFGTPEQCIAMVDRLRAIGVDEIACLIDFGVPFESALAALPALKRLKELCGGAARGAESAAAATGAAAPGAAAQDGGPSIAAEIRAHAVTHLQCTPSMARLLCLDPDARAALLAIPNVMIGGEAFPTTLAAELAGCPGRVTNMYGPTETTIWSSTHDLEKGATQIPIGRPIANTRFYVLDARREPLPLGVPGELWIAGDGVARGYHARPELTAERFVADPFRAGWRMYRTGDLVRRRPDGVVEFLGRLDHQVKIRGYRIELGEIESLLGGHPRVREAVVVAGTDAHGEARLVGYVVPRDGGASVSDGLQGDLRDALRAQVPEYMVPSHFVSLPAFPLTPNGKVDRKALPAPETASVPERVTFAAPASELEEKLARLWREILSIEKIGIDDNFFDVGGHSLLVVRMHRKIGTLVDRPVSLTDLYRFPTIRSFAAWAASDGANQTLDRGAERGARRRESLLRRRRG